MKKNHLIFLLFVISLAACSAPVNPTTTPVNPSPMLSPSPGITPSSTPHPTRTLTPLPTIPTFTPTFDARTIVTVTPAPRAECPKEDPSLKINLQYVNPYAPDDATGYYEYANNLGDVILEALNKGLATSTLVDELKKQSLKSYYQDVTNDGIKDVLLDDFGFFRIFYCQYGSYKLFTDEYSYAGLHLSLVNVIDLNKNGLPEILLSEVVLGKRGAATYITDEWNGSTFINLTRNPIDKTVVQMFGPKNFELEDINQDGLEDLVLTSEGPWDEDLYSRVKTVVYSWNGQFYGETYTSFATPEYRFQAVEDGDRETLYGNTQKALAFYQQAILDDKLKWWSLERRTNDYENYAAHHDFSTPIAYPSPPTPDETEYPKLAAYAYYRIMILYIYSGKIDAAQTQYTILQTKFPAGSPGHPYAEMASAFWDAYQASGSMYNACAAAIAFANIHPEILIPLGSDYHGSQSHIYTPADVCPFR